METIKEKLEILLEANKIEVDEAVLDIYISGVIQNILNYCNLTELPSELDYVVIQLVLNQCSQVSGGSSQMGSISSISEGGRTVSFATSSGKTYQDFDKETTRILDKFKVLYK